MPSGAPKMPLKALGIQSWNKIELLYKEAFGLFLTKRATEGCMAFNS